VGQEEYSPDAESLREPKLGKREVCSRSTPHRETWSLQ